MSDPPLLPCPFCGGEAVFEECGGPTVDARSWSVGCKELPDAEYIMCYGYQSLTTFPTKREAAAAWNRRAPIGQ